MRTCLQNELRRIDGNIAELQRLTMEQKEVIILRLREGRDTAKEETTYRGLQVSSREMERNRVTTAKLLLEAEADYDALPSGVI
jgi:hypothetical protein